MVPVTQDPKNVGLDAATAAAHEVFDQCRKGCTFLGSGNLYTASERVEVITSNGTNTEHCLCGIKVPVDDEGNTTTVHCLYGLGEPHVITALRVAVAARPQC
jgi:hypothetical protein